jgi:hypothetical protein
MVPTYHDARGVVIILLGPGVVRAHTPTKEIATLEDIEYFQLHPHSLFELRILAQNISGSCFGHGEMEVGFGIMGWNEEVWGSDAYL